MAKKKLCKVCRYNENKGSVLCDPCRKSFDNAFFAPEKLGLGFTPDDSEIGAIWGAGRARRCDKAEQDAERSDLGVQFREIVMRIKKHDEQLAEDLVDILFEGGFI